MGPDRLTQAEARFLIGREMALGAMRHLDEASREHLPTSLRPTGAVTADEGGPVHTHAVP